MNRRRAWWVVLVLRGVRARHDGAADLLVEIPHGATRTDDFRSLEKQLTSPLPDSLVDFFHVNTDAGAPELGEAAARRVSQVVAVRYVFQGGAVKADTEDHRGLGLVAAILPGRHFLQSRRDREAPRR